MKHWSRAGNWKFVRQIVRNRKNIKFFSFTRRFYKHDIPYVSHSKKETKMNPLNKYTCIKQHDIADCAAACLATISKQYGLKIPITKIREVLGTDKSK